MRKLVVFVMLMTCVISAQAQWKVTPEAGMNVTKYKGDAAKVGFKAGAAVSYTFGSGWFSLQSGLYYVRRGKGLFVRLIWESERSSNLSVVRILGYINSWRPVMVISGSDIIRG